MRDDTKPTGFTGLDVEDDKVMDKINAKYEFINIYFDTETLIANGKTKKVGKEIAPKDFPKADKERWDEIWNKRKWSASYPFSVENVKEFAEFCRFSGGFKIC